MKTIIAGIFSTVFICVAFAGVFFLIGYWIVKAGKRAIQRENEYENHYSDVKKMIDEYYILPANYDYIMGQFKKFHEMKYKNREKTSVLFCDFVFKYRTETKRRVLQN